METLEVCDVQNGNERTKCLQLMDLLSSDMDETVVIEDEQLETLRRHGQKLSAQTGGYENSENVRRSIDLLDQRLPSRGNAEAGLMDYLMNNFFSSVVNIRIQIRVKSPMCSPPFLVITDEMHYGDTSILPTSK